MRPWRPQPEPLGAVRRAATPLGSVQWGLSVVVAPWWLRPRAARVSRTEAGRPAGPGLRPWGPCSRLLPSPGSEGQEAPRRVLSDLSCRRGRSSRGCGRLAGGPHRCLVAASASVHSKLGGGLGAAVPATATAVSRVSPGTPGGRGTQSQGATLSPLTRNPDLRDALVATGTGSFCRAWQSGPKPRALPPPQL